MYLAYVDESGTWYKKDKSENYVLAGFLVSEYKWRALDDGIRELKKRFFPALIDVELHTVDIVHGRNQFQRIDIKMRCDFLKELAAFISKSEIRVFCVVMKKELIANDYIIFNMAYELLYERIAWNVSQLNKGLIAGGSSPNHALIFIDRHSGPTNVQIRVKLDQLMTKGSTFDFNNMIIEYPVFTDSKWRGSIQLADAIAYAFNYENTSSKRTHVVLHQVVSELFKAALNKMADPSPASPAYCYKIWPKKKAGG